MYISEIWGNQINLMLNFTTISLILVACAGITGVLTCLYIRYAHVKNLMDIPNHRSSHQAPVPRGGGISFTITFLVAIALLTFFGAVSYTSGLAVLLVGGVTALTGYYDDKFSLTAKLRLAFHFVAASILIYLADYVAKFDLVWFRLDIGYLGVVFTLLMTVWLLNLYNFMDGINGIAGGEAVTVAGVAAFIFFSVGDIESALLSSVLACCVLGFMPFNFPKAKVFMGDIGSGFLGIIFASLLVVAYGNNPDSFWIWLILLGVFIVDATYTLLYRLLTGFKPHHAHRSHAYQKLAQKLNSHGRVSTLIYAINLLWLAPLAYGVANEVFPGFIGLLIAYLPLLLFVWSQKAGEN